MSAMRQTTRKRWNRDEVRKVLPKVKTITELSVKFSGAYRWAKTHDPEFFDELRQHFNTNYSFVSDEELRAVCEKYTTVEELYTNENQAYQALVRRKLLDTYGAHLIRKQPVRVEATSRKPLGYWTKERCAEIATKYKNRSEMQKNDQTAYQKSYRNGWLDEFFGKAPNQKKRGRGRPRKNA